MQNRCGRVGGGGGVPATSITELPLPPPSPLHSVLLHHQVPQAVPQALCRRPPQQVLKGAVHAQDEACRAKHVRARHTTLTASRLMRGGRAHRMRGEGGGAHRMRGRGRREGGERWRERSTGVALITRRNPDGRRMPRGGGFGRGGRRTSRHPEQRTAGESYLWEGGAARVPTRHLPNCHQSSE